MNEDDKKIFKKAMQGVKLLGDTNKHHKTKQKVEKTSKKTFHEELQMPILSLNVDPIEAEASIAFARDGVQPNQLKRLQRGQIRHEAILDLHHFTVEQAKKSLVQFISLSQQQGYRYVQVIHGKGYHTAPGQISLKSYANTWLRELKEILAFSSSAPAHGGTGAVSIILKK